ncbi:DUF3934 family protein [Bacillus sp. DX1.1]|uniref:DUF3934 family protein n=1 Tax=unclassified Bacillus (in: firmicutes) TaxID=185979 RepID=UPI0025700203|nr:MULTISPECIES: DUF3934 family protein [unclassified Bacillus (in: firmicutes)]MDM5153806.1 DUF3934 family protein [Bacillus sp. DX1.1]MDM5187463.1 DUF3934 family protein [Bacillus sp. DX4.1]WJE82742.1 DUF3934 family protein [Bacillus sp. DX3.1]
MSKAKGKGGTGRGTGSKGWNRWKASAKKKKNAKPYTSKGVKKSTGTKTTSSNEGDKSEI